MSVAALNTTVQLAGPSASTQPSRASTIAKHAVIGGAIGAAVGGVVGLLGLPIPFIGAIGAPIAAAIGGAAGLAIGGLVGFLRSRSSVTDTKVVGTAVGQAVPPPPGTSGTSLPPALPPS